MFDSDWVLTCDSAGRRGTIGHNPSFACSSQFALEPRFNCRSAVVK
jgi:hypothetical protein